MPEGRYSKLLRLKDIGLPYKKTQGKGHIHDPRYNKDLYGHWYDHCLDLDYLEDISNRANAHERLNKKVDRELNEPRETIANTKRYRMRPGNCVIQAVDPKSSS